MIVSSLSSPLYLCNYDAFIKIINPINHSVITNSNAVKVFQQFLATGRAGNFL
jgi:hypothetical protein